MFTFGLRRRARGAWLAYHPACRQKFPHGFFAIASVYTSELVDHFCNFGWQNVSHKCSLLTNLYTKTRSAYRGGGGEGKRITRNRFSRIEPSSGLNDKPIGLFG